ncbi:MAG: aldehyde ferredoxin oxidoreductase family protein, partial [Chloroflexota bacterium]|nr:aldehyde ferredoxin oxidoreductase family protein [Chloroflexota bacterium]
MYGYMDKILRVDLTNASVQETPLDPDAARKYIGGSGLSAKIIYDELDPDVDPLSPENLLVFATGPYQGTAVYFSGRHSVCTKSPLTGIWAEATSGGFWGYSFKRTGYDALVLTGKAKNPVYLYISDAGVEIRDASYLWGLDSYETESRLKEELKGLSVRVACIGQGGENLVRFAGVANDMGRIAGRCGVGAVMGSKNLKAIVVHGTKKPPVADQALLSKYIRGLKASKDNPLAVIFGKYGTAMFLDTFESIGDVPFQYWTKGDARRGRNAKLAAKVGGAAMYKQILTKNYHCYACPIGCGRIVKVTSPEKYATEGHGPEYESAAAFGTLCMIDSLAAVAKMNDMCNRYGVDTIEMGSIVAFAMSCYEKGWITKADTDGIELNWGNADAAITLIEKVVKREGFGVVLADGLLPAARAIGHGSESIVIHSKGQSFAMHDPRAFHGLALSYGTSERGACHLHGMGWLEMAGFGFSPYSLGGKRVKKYSLEGQPLSTKATQDLA